MFENREIQRLGLFGGALLGRHPPMRQISAYMFKVACMTTVFQRVFDALT
jgi:hypothetical protein